MVIEGAMEQCEQPICRPILHSKQNPDRQSFSVELELPYSELLQMDDINAMKDYLEQMFDQMRSLVWMAREAR